MRHNDFIQSLKNEVMKENVTFAETFIHPVEAAESAVSFPYIVYVWGEFEPDSPKRIKQRLDLICFCEGNIHTLESR